MSTLTNGVTKVNEVAATIKSTQPNTFANIWTMYYWKGGNPNQTKNFTHDGDFKSAYSVAKDYCQKMSFRLMYIKPFITDLDADIKRLTSENAPS